MSELRHLLKVFVYRLRAGAPDYLLLRREMGLESCWGPLQGRVGFGEQLETAIQREVHEDTGIVHPADLIDLQMPAHWLLGDEEVIEWHYAVRALRLEDPDRLRQRCAAFRWVDFSEAYPVLELEADRAAITRLHTLLSAA